MSTVLNRTGSTTMDTERSSNRVNVTDSIFESWADLSSEPSASRPAGQQPSEPPAASTEPSASPAPETASQPQERTARGRLNALVDLLRDDRFKDELQAILDELQGESFESYEDNADVVAKLNIVIKALGVSCHLAGTGERVNIRCIKPPRSKRGNIQARSADRQQKALASGDCFPHLEVR